MSIEKPTHDEITKIVEKMHEYDRSPEGIASNKKMQDAFKESIYGEKEIRYTARDDGKHWISVPPSQIEGFYNGEEHKPEINEWLKENTPTYTMDVVDSMCDVDYIFETKTDAMAFKLRWC